MGTADAFETGTRAAARVVVLATFRSCAAAPWMRTAPGVGRTWHADRRGTLYPLLRRLEAQGLLKSGWKIEDGPPRRYYPLNADGWKLLKKLTESWQGMNAAMGDS